MKKGVWAVLFAGFLFGGMTAGAAGTVEKILTEDEAQNSVIYMYLPANVDGAVAFSGSDVAIDSSWSGFADSAYVKNNGRTVDINTASISFAPAGTVGTVHIQTQEGRTISIIVVSLGDDGEYEAGDVVAKVLITD